MERLRILIADDHEVVRQGIVGMLTSRRDWEVCGQASDGREAIKMIEKLKPDLVILDITMPGLNGIDTARQVRKLMPDIKILIYSMHYAERLVQEVFQAGADGYVLKTDAGKHLVQSIETIMSGQRFVSSKVSEVIFEGFLRGSSGASPSGEPAQSTEERLSARERETVQLLAEGKSNKEVAAILGISPKTAETHRATIMRKLGLSTFSDLVRYAVRNGIIEP
jgi:DNA-binding NarL/FixJ family response regulator